MACVGSPLRKLLQRVRGGPRRLLAPAVPRRFASGAPRVSVRSLLASEPQPDGTTVQGWVRSLRRQKRVCFIQVHDGSCADTLQVVATPDQCDGLSTGCSVSIRGKLAASPGAGQRFELQAESVRLVGACPIEYPMQKKEHSKEFLREHAHLRHRTAAMGSVMRLRSQAQWAVHDFFRALSFHMVHTPLIVANDCEGAGELFSLHTKAQGAAFFGRDAYLTVSGQLHGEAMAMGLGQVYTFGPTFRAEASQTRQHLAEFWMVEPEMAWAGLDDIVANAEALVRHCVSSVLEHGSGDVDVLTTKENRLRQRLEGLVHASAWQCITYTDAIRELRAVRGRQWDVAPEWGMDLQREHERWLCEEMAQGAPVTVTHFPAAIKPFYAKAAAHNDAAAPGPTSLAMDVLLPDIGELVGGSVREDDAAVLLQQMTERGLDPGPYQWYMDLRTYGTVPHAGYGLGFERLLLLLTGMDNIRDVVVSPRYVSHCNF